MKDTKQKKVTAVRTVKNDKEIAAAVQRGLESVNLQPWRSSCDKHEAQQDSFAEKSL